jgi:acyl-coenzyme A thioesterase PaaI-like protein
MKKKQANSRSCFVCGVENRFGLQLKFYETEPGHVVAETIVPEHFQGYPGVVHGGIVAAMLDEVSGRAMIRGEPPRWMVTAKLEVRYRKPVPVGKRLLLEGHAKEDNGRVATVTGAIYNEDHVLLAEADAVLSNIPQHLLATAALGPEDWKVFPDEEETV